MKEAEGEDYVASRREEYLCSSQTEPISACCHSFCRHQGDVYEGWFQVTFIIHLDLVCISIPKNGSYFFNLIPKPAYKLNMIAYFLLFFRVR